MTNLRARPRRGLELGLCLNNKQRIRVSIALLKKLKSNLVLLLFGIHTKICMVPSKYLLEAFTTYSRTGVPEQGSRDSEGSQRIL